MLYGKGLGKLSIGSIMVDVKLFDSDVFLFFKRDVELSFWRCVNYNVYEYYDDVV